MTDIAIRVERLGKRYRIGRRERYRTIRETLVETVAAPLRRAKTAFYRPPPAARPEDFWALRDVSFEVPRGCVLGVVGSNGAGKSTLLKILSRITEPTTGEIEIRGRVGSLLEVGTGFHPELTGRENVLLNGAILGMRRAEILENFDKIVTFAEVDKFIDTPVKRYSSGMYMRLAFSVAAHLEPDILVVDEVLAVGDAQFQAKCIGKMNDVAKHGRTVIFVSHNLVALERLCTQAILLRHGQLEQSGRIKEVLSTYLTTLRTSGANALIDTTHRSGTGDVRITGLSVKRSDSLDELRAGDPISVTLNFRSSGASRRAVFSVSIWTAAGACLFGIYTNDLNYSCDVLPSVGAITLTIRNPNLLAGRYYLHCAAGDESNPLRFDHLPDAMSFDVIPADVYRSGRAGAASWSSLFFDCEWRLVDESSGPVGIGESSAHLTNV